MHHHQEIQADSAKLFLKNLSDFPSILSAFEEACLTKKEKAAGGTQYSRYIKYVRSKGLVGMHMFQNHKKSNVAVHARSREAPPRVNTTREVKNVRMLGHNFSHELIFCVRIPTASSHNRKTPSKQTNSKEKAAQENECLEVMTSLRNSAWLVTTMALMTRAKLTIYETFFETSNQRTQTNFFIDVFLQQGQNDGANTKLLSYLLSPPIILQLTQYPQSRVCHFVIKGRKKGV